MHARLSAFAAALATLLAGSAGVPLHAASPPPASLARRLVARALARSAPQAVLEGSATAWTGDLPPLASVTSRQTWRVTVRTYRTAFARVAPMESAAMALLGVLAFGRPVSGTCRPARPALAGDTAACRLTERVAAFSSPTTQRTVVDTLAIAWPSGIVLAFTGSLFTWGAAPRYLARIRFRPDGAAARPAPPSPPASGESPGLRAARRAVFGRGTLPVGALLWQSRSTAGGRPVLYEDWLTPDGQLALNAPANPRPASLPDHAIHRPGGTTTAFLASGSQTETYLVWRGTRRRPYDEATVTLTLGPWGPMRAGQMVPLIRALVGATDHRA